MLGVQRARGPFSQPGLLEGDDDHGGKHGVHFLSSSIAACLLGNRRLFQGKSTSSLARVRVPVRT